ncbi:MAG TPA: chromosomal replication initiator protein DnaA [Candidatus Hydrogenedentes bacterium]|nr:chromosomal replication initiator protein DnaA [Candidatus Hydrogenedentota bacterium]
MVSDKHNPWELAQTRLQERLDEHSYKNWFSQTRFVSYDNGSLTIGVPSQFFADWLRDHYIEAISDCMRECSPGFVEVFFRPVTDMPPAPQDGPAGKPSNRSQTPKRPLARVDQRFDGFNHRYTFDRFVIGAGNRFAHAAARAVAESPARAYNPLFLYGDTGLGKTHLMQAIGQEVLQRRPEASVAFISSEDFTNQLIESIAKKSTQKFRARFRKVDVLLIDDIHFIAGKEATQEEFFHTFNALFDMHKQIVLSSDRQPKEINGLEDRLLSRFEWGLVTDIQPPDLETRVAILQNKAAEENAVVPADVLRYIATYVATNIRELEGTLITLLAYAKLTERKITLHVAEDVLHDLIGREKIKPVTIENIQRAVAEYFDLRIADLKSRNRQRQVSFPRQLAMFLCKDLVPNLSLSEIGEAFGGKDHTTVLYACQQIAEKARNNPETRQVLAHLQKVAQA